MRNETVRDRFTVHDHFTAAKQRIEKDVSETLSEVVLTKNAGEWVDELVEAVSLPLTEEVGDHVVATETVQEAGYDSFEREIAVETVYFAVDLILNHHAQLMTVLSLRPRSWDPSLPEFRYWEGKFSFKIQVSSSSQLHEDFIQKQAKGNLERTIEQFRKEFKLRNEEIKLGMRDIRLFTEDLVKRKIAQAGKEEVALKQLSELIQIPLRKKTETIPIVPIQEKKDLPKATVKHPSLPTGKPKEYIIDEKDFLNFIEHIENYLKDCERTTHVFAKLKEEEIRDLILPHLNQVFKRGATGETFSKGGRADIYIQVEAGCILVCECKWWSGAKSLDEVIDQVLERVTWRENYGVVIVFVRGDVSSVLGKVEGIIAEHQSNIEKRAVKISQAHFSSRNKLPGDIIKQVKIHYLFCHFPPKKEKVKKRGSGK